MQGSLDAYAYITANRPQPRGDWLGVLGRSRQGDAERARHFEAGPICHPRLYKNAHFSGATARAAERPLSGRSGMLQAD